MHNQFELPVSITIHPSVWLKLWIYLLHIGSIPAVLFSGVPLYIVVVIIPAILVSLIMVRHEFLSLKSSSSITRIFHNELDEWWLTAANEHTFKAILMPAALVHPLLTVLCFKSGKEKYPVILAPDSAPSDALRLLRVRLRFQKHTKQSSVAS